VHELEPKLINTENVKVLGNIDRKIHDHIMENLLQLSQIQRNFSRQ